MTTDDMPDARSTETAAKPAPVSAGLILAGGLGLGAYQAGAFQVLAGSGRFAFEVLAGSSIGAINGAILAGSPPEQRAERLLAFWSSVETDFAALVAPDPYGLEAFAPVRHARNWLNVAGSHLIGVRGMFQPRPGGMLGASPSLYDTDPLLDRFKRFIDFDRLNGGELRYVLATTDVETGETVTFDTGAGDRIGPDHLLASGGLIPSFPAVEIAGRLLADGGLSANAPLEPLLASTVADPPPVLVLLDLFAPDGACPRTLEDAAHRGNDLKFATQTARRLEGLQRELALQTKLSPERAGADLLYLSYRPIAGEAGLEKTYDFSAPTLARRIAAGAADAHAALHTLAKVEPGGAPGLRIHRIRRP